MQQLAAQGVNDAPAIINRMMAYVPDPHKILVGTSNAQLIALSNEFPGFYRYALIMEEASEAERNKASRPCDGVAQFSEQQKQLVTQLLAMAATLERGYQAFLGSGDLQVFQPQVSPIPAGATTSCSMNTFTATTGRGWARAIRPAGPGAWRNSSSFMGSWMPSGFWKGASRVHSREETHERLAEISRHL